MWFRILLVAGLLILTADRAANADILWRLSVNYILGPSGERAQGSPGDLADDPQGVVDEMNALLESYGRGYQVTLVEVSDIQSTLVEDLWDDNAVDATRKAIRDAIEVDAAALNYRTDAINLYVVAGGAGYCSFPADPAPLRNVMVVGASAAGRVALHETGHFFNLSHPFGADDNVDDTIQDLSNGNQEDIAQLNFGADYADLSASQQGLVDDVYFNLMSYHPTQVRLTHGQLDRMTDASNDTRTEVVPNALETVFIDASASPVGADGSSTNPYASVAAGNAAASSDDTLLLRGGNYSENPILTGPRTLRAAEGWAVVGGP